MSDAEQEVCGTRAPGEARGSGVGACDKSAGACDESAGACGEQGVRRECKECDQCAEACDQGRLARRAQRRRLRDEGTVEHGGNYSEDCYVRPEDLLYWNGSSGSKTRNSAL